MDYLDSVQEWFLTWENLAIQSYQKDYANTSPLYTNVNIQIIHDKTHKLDKNNEDS